MNRVLSCLSFLWMGSALFGCQTTCEQACNRIIDTCGAGIPSYSDELCTTDCTLVQEEYKRHDYLADKLEKFNASLNCVRDTDCEELVKSGDESSPACFDDSLFVFRARSSLETTP